MHVGEIVRVRASRGGDAGRGVCAPACASARGKLCVPTPQGHFFGETSLVKDEPRNANVKVKSSSATVMSIGKAVFNPFLQREEGFRRFIGA